MFYGGIVSNAKRAPRAPKNQHYLVIAENTDGRACGWGKAASLEDATRVADDMWTMHGNGDGCYPGERRAPNVVHLVSPDPIDPRRKSP